MLRKLLKHEFRATARVMGPLFLIMLILSAMANLSLRFLLDADSFIPNLLGGLLFAAFGIGMVALVIISIVLMVNRFRTNLMGDEGYVMFTLPVSSHKIVWSKIIVSTVWFAATVAVECLAGLISVFDLQMLRDIFSSRFFSDLGEMFQFLIQEFGLNLPVMTAELLVVCFLLCAVLCLGFYAAIAAGHSFANHKMAFSLLFFFGFQFILQFLSGSLIYLLDESPLYYWIYDISTTGQNGMAAFHLAMAVTIVSLLATGAVYYVITSFTLKRHLNLQ